MPSSLRLKQVTQEPKQLPSSLRKKETSPKIQQEKQPEPEKGFIQKYNERQSKSRFYPDKEELQKTGKTLQGFASGATIGLSENIPGMERDKEDTSSEAARFIGSFLPFSAAMKIIQNPITKKTAEWAMKSPYAQQSLAYMGKLLGIGTAGAAYKGAEEAFQGEIPDPRKMADEGIIWAALDTALNVVGKGAVFTKALINRARTTGKSSEKILQEVSEAIRKENLTEKNSKNSEKIVNKALETLKKEPEALTREHKAAIPEVEPISDIEKMGQRLSAEQNIKVETDLRNKKIDPVKVGQLEDIGIEKAESYKPEDIDFTKTLEQAEKEGLESKLNEFHPETATNQELGQTLQRDIQTQYKAAKAAEESLYKPVKEKSKSIVANSPLAKAQAKKTLADIKFSKKTPLKTQPPGYATLQRDLENVLSDIGNGFSSVAKMIEVKQRLNDMINHELLEPYIRNKLKLTKNALIKDIKAALSKDSELALQFEIADATHARNEELFNNENMIGIRRSSLPERIPDKFESPTILKNIKEVTSTEQHKAIEKAFLDNLKKQNAERAAELVKENSKYLSSEANELAKDILTSKNPSLSKKITTGSKGAIVKDLTEMVETGKRPDNVLNMWKTPQGRKLVNEALKDSVNKKEIIKYLEKQSIADFGKTILKENGEIDFKLLNKLMKDPAIRQSIEAVGGKDAVRFFEKMQPLEEGIKRNILVLDKIEKSGKAAAAKKGEVGYGKLKLERQKQKNLAPIEKRKEILESNKEKVEQAGKATQEKGLYGKEKIKRAEEKISKRKEAIEKETKRKAAPISSKLEEMINSLGIIPAVLISGSGIISPLIYKTGAAAYVFVKICESQAVRDAARKAAQKGISPKVFISSLVALDEVVD